MVKQPVLLFERAAKLIDELENHPAGSDKEIIAALDAQELEELERIVNKYEGMLAQEYFAGEGASI